MVDRAPTSQRPLVVSEADEGARIDVVLGRRVPGVSRRVARRLALEGHVFCNGHAVAPSMRVHRGDLLSIAPDTTPTAEVLPTALDVLEVSTDYVFVSKPRAIHTHRLGPHEPRALADLVEDHFPECRSASPQAREGGVLHRLDRATTGVVAFARNPDAWLRGRDAIAGCARKLYVAMVDAEGSPRETKANPHELPTVRCLATTSSDPPLVVDAPLSASRRPPLVDAPLSASCHPPLVDASLSTSRGAAFVVDAPLSTSGPHVRWDPAGLPAQTRVWFLGRDDSGARILLISLHGGRRHQIRVHLAGIGWPIVGDPLYGAGSPESPLMLHAIQLDLQPGTTQPVEAPLPWPWPELC